MLIHCSEVDVSKESDFEAWYEIRARVDSVANSLFLVAGGALSVSIAVLLGGKTPKLSETSKCLTIFSWQLLLYSIISFALIKGILIIQAYKIYNNSSHKNAWHKHTTRSNWFLGITGILAFIIGMFLLVRAASIALA